MQINVINGTSPALFNAMLFPEMPSDTREWLYNQFQRPMDALTEVGRTFINNATQMFQDLYDPNLMRKARSIMRTVGGLMHPNTITEIVDIDALAKARPVMQRYIMAQPDLRSLYHRQLCDGYSDSYVDRHPGQVGESHYDYRRVMNNIVKDVVNEDGVETWKVVQYLDDLEVGDRELDASEQFCILNTWDLVRQSMKLKIDPTDIFGGKLEI